MPSYLDRFDHVIQVRWALLAKYFIHLQCYLPHSIELKYRRVYSYHFHTTIAKSINTTPNSIQCPFNCYPEILFLHSFTNNSSSHSSPIPLFLCPACRHLDFSQFLTEYIPKTCDTIWLPGVSNIYQNDGHYFD